jgi:hypothetical protein
MWGYVARIAAIPKGKRALRRHAPMWKDNNKLDVMGMECEGICGLKLLWTGYSEQVLKLLIS